MRLYCKGTFVLMWTEVVYYPKDHPVYVVRNLGSFTISPRPWIIQSSRMIPLKTRNVSETLIQEELELTHNSSSLSTSGDKEKVGYWMFSNAPATPSSILVFNNHDEFPHSAQCTELANSVLTQLVLALFISWYCRGTFHILNSKVKLYWRLPFFSSRYFVS